MFQSRLQKLRKLEGKARESLGSLNGHEHRIELEAMSLDAEITAFRMVCLVHEKGAFHGHMTHEEHHRAMYQRYKLSEPLAIKERYTDLRQLVEKYGASPEVRTVLVRARAFLNGES